MKNLKRASSCPEKRREPNREWTVYWLIAGKKIFLGWMQEQHNSSSSGQMKKKNKQCEVTVLCFCILFSSARTDSRTAHSQYKSQCDVTAEVDMRHFPLANWMKIGFERSTTTISTKQHSSVPGHPCIEHTFKLEEQYYVSVAEEAKEKKIGFDSKKRKEKRHAC